MLKLLKAHGLGILNESWREKPPEYLLAKGTWYVFGNLVFGTLSSVCQRAASPEARTEPPLVVVIRL